MTSAQPLQPLQDLCDTRQLPGLGNLYLYSVGCGEALEVPSECGQQEGGS